MSRIAVFDIGTVTCRLGVFEVENQRLVKTVYKDLEICNLGMGTDASSLLNEEALERVLECITRFVRLASEFSPDACICTLTSAARDARNSEKLLCTLRNLGIQPQVIPGSIEGMLTFLGVAQNFPGVKIVVMDSGGGSTEMCFGSMCADRLDIDWVHSFDIGARRITERFFKKDCARLDKDYIHALNASKAIFKHDEFKLDPQAYRLIGVGGTTTTLSAIDNKLDVYDPQVVHLSRLSLERIEQLGLYLNAMDTKARTQIPGLQPQRADVIVGGICTVQACMESFNYHEMIVSESDILCGLAIVADSTYKFGENVVEWNAQLFNI